MAEPRKGGAGNARLPGVEHSEDWLEQNQNAGVNMPDYLGKIPGSLNDEKQ